jgi:hypothetical protein
VYFEIAAAIPVPRGKKKPPLPAVPIERDALVCANSDRAAMLLASDVGRPIPSNFAARLRVNLTIVSPSDQLSY